MISYRNHFILRLIFFQELRKVSHIIFIIHLSWHLIYHKFIYCRMHTFASLIFKLLQLVAKKIDLWSEFYQESISIINYLFVLTFLIFSLFKSRNHLFKSLLFHTIFHFNSKFRIFLIKSYSFLSISSSVEVCYRFLFHLLINVVKIWNKNSTFHFLSKELLFLFIE